MNSHGNSANTLEVNLLPFEVADHPGENAVIIEVEQNGVVIATRGQLWENAGCELSGSRACGAEP